MGYGNVAPAPLIRVCWPNAADILDATRAIPRMAPFICRTINSVSLFNQACVTERLLSERWGRSGQGIAQVDETHGHMGVSGCSRCRKPRIPLEIGVLEHEVDGPPFGVAHERCVATESDFLDGPVLAVARNGAISDLGGTVGVERHILRDVNATVITVKQ